MVRNYSIKELSHRAIRAVFKRHLLSSQFSSVQFGLEQFEQQASTGLSLYDCYDCGHIMSLRVFVWSLGDHHMKYSLDKGDAGPYSL